MNGEVMDRERKLIDDVQRALPSFVQACASKDNKLVLMSQDAFAAQLTDDEFLLLGKAIKYAGLMHKEVTIVPSATSRPL